MKNENVEEKNIVIEPKIALSFAKTDVFDD